MNRPRLLVDTRLPIEEPSAFSLLGDDFLVDRLLRGGDSSTSVHSDDDVLPCSCVRLLLGLSFDSITSMGLETTSRGGGRGEASGYERHMACISLVHDVLHPPDRYTKHDRR